MTNPIGVYGDWCCELATVDNGHFNYVIALSNVSAAQYHQLHIQGVEAWEAFKDMLAKNTDALEKGATEK